MGGEEKRRLEGRQKEEEEARLVLRSLSGLVGMGRIV